MIIFEKIIDFNEDEEGLLYNYTRICRIRDDAAPLSGPVKECLPIATFPGGSTEFDLIISSLNSLGFPGKKFFLYNSLLVGFLKTTSIKEIRNIIDYDNDFLNREVSINNVKDHLYWECIDYLYKDQLFKEKVRELNLLITSLGGGILNKYLVDRYFIDRFGYKNYSLYLYLKENNEI